MKKIYFLAFVASVLLSACSGHITTLEPTAGPSLTITPSAIPSAIVSNLPDITPTGFPINSSRPAKILIEEASGFYVASPDGSNNQLVISHSDTILNAALSNDQTRVAYLSAGILYVKNIQTGEIKQLSQETIGGTPAGIGWSPDDETIGLDCSTNSTPVFEICTFRVGDGHLQVLTRVEQYASSNQNIIGGGAQFGSWSGDGGQIVFVTRFGPSVGGPAQGIIQILNFSSGTVETVFDERKQNNISDVTNPVISPDGRTILFVGKFAGKGEIFQINVDGSGLKQVTKPGHEYDITYPIWNPDGSQFFAFTARNGDPNITGVPTLFSLNGDLTAQLNIDFGQVRCWVK